MIFPEGQRTRTGKMGPFSEGIGHLALGIGAPVPVRLRSAFELLPPDASFPKRGDVSAHIGKPYFANGENPQKAAGKLKRIIEICSILSGNLKRQRLYTCHLKSAWVHPKSGSETQQATPGGQE